MAKSSLGCIADCPVSISKSFNVIIPGGCPIAAAAYRHLLNRKDDAPNRGSDCRASLSMLYDSSTTQQGRIICHSYVHPLFHHQSPCYLSSQKHSELCRVVWESEMRCIVVHFINEMLIRAGEELAIVDRSFSHTGLCVFIAITFIQDILWRSLAETVAYLTNV